MVVNTVTFILYTIVGYFGDIAINYMMLKFLLKSHASMASLGLFEIIQNAVSFALGIFFGFSLIAFNIATIAEALLVMGGWFLISGALAWKMLGIGSLPKLLAFILLDSGLDYIIGGVVAVPSSASLLSFVPQNPIGSATQGLVSIVPLSFHWIVIPIAIGGFLLIYALEDKIEGEKPALIAEEEED